jgi:O-methyltransferase
MRDPEQSSPVQLPELYLRALKLALTRGGGVPAPVRAANWKRHVIDPVQAWLERRGYRLVPSPSSPMWSEERETMISVARLDNVQECVEQVVRDQVPGDLVEAGVWRGGTVIFMRALLAVHDVRDRKVWAADSFEGFPPLRRHDDDREQDFTAGLGGSFWSVGLDVVRDNVERYGLLDDQIVFLPGWFCDTLPQAPIQEVAVLRLDGDLYESTRDAISALEPRVSAGGFVIVDDYGSYEQCRHAVDEYRDQRGIADPIEAVDGHCVFWRKSSDDAGRGNLHPTG